MQYKYIGKSGLRVSPICLGTMSFGSWSNEQESFAIMDKAIDSGINFFDTAEIYPVPLKEEYVHLTETIIGKWLKNKDRTKIIIASKVAGASSGWFIPPIRHGLTAIDKHHIKIAIEGSLKRLGTDYIDLYQVHWPDTIVPMEESMRALDELVREGKVRYLGTSNESAYGLTKSNTIAQYENLNRFQSIQNNFSLLNRRFLDELANVCKRENISLLPYSPLGGGVLSGKYNQKPFPKIARFSEYLAMNSKRHKAMSDKFLNDKTLASTQQYLQIAQEYNLNPIAMAIAWSMSFDFVASSIIGVRNTSQLDDILPSIDIKLDKKILKKLDNVHSKYLYPMG